MSITTNVIETVITIAEVLILMAPVIFLLNLLTILIWFNIANKDNYILISNVNLEKISGL